MLEAAAALLGEVGYDGLSIGGIAARAGVGRQTIYRWWDSKSAIVAEAVVEGLIALDEPMDAAPTTPAEWLAGFATGLRDAHSVSLVRALAAASAEDDAESAALYARLTAPAHAQLVALMGGTDAAEARADAAIGALLYRVLTRRPIDDETVAALVRLVG